MPSIHKKTTCTICGLSMRADKVKKHILRMHEVPSITNTVGGTSEVREIVSEGPFAGLVIPTAQDCWDYESGRKSMAALWAEYDRVPVL